MQRTLCLLLALVMLATGAFGQSKRRRTSAVRSNPGPARPTALTRTTALSLLRSVVPTIDSGLRYRSARVQVPFAHYRATAAGLRQDPWFRAAEHLGWITLWVGETNNPDFPTVTTVSFTAEGARLFDGSTPGYACEGGILHYCTFRVAELRVESVTAIRRTAPTEAEVLYVWTYQPLPALRIAGAAAEAWAASAVFARFDDGWRITRLGL